MQESFPWRSTALPLLQLHFLCCSCTYPVAAALPLLQLHFLCCSTALPLPLPRTAPVIYYYYYCSSSSSSSISLVQYYGLESSPAILISPAEIARCTCKRIYSKRTSKTRSKYGLESSDILISPAKIARCTSTSRCT